jgi:hypothetical protein
VAACPEFVLQLVQRELNPCLLIQKQTVHLVTGDLAQRVLNKFFTEGRVVFKRSALTA